MPGNATMTLAALLEAHIGELAAVRADAARELAARESAAAEIAQSHQREVVAGALVIEELRRRAESAEAEAGRLAAQLTERELALSTLQARPVGPHEVHEQQGDPLNQPAKKRWWWPF